MTEFAVEGEDSTPALNMQLQDALVLGLALAGVKVLDPVDVAKRLAQAPDLLRCDTSACFKQAGQALDARTILRIKVTVSGNNYKAAARLFSTEGIAPAVLPIAARQRFCDVCTVEEARTMLRRLAEEMRRNIEAPPAALPPPPPPPPGARRGTMIGLGVGVGLIAVGAAWLASSGDLPQRSAAFAGAIVSAGAIVAGASLYFVFDAGPRTPTRPGTTVALGASWRW